VSFFGKGTVGASMAADEVGLKANCIYFTNEDDKGRGLLVSTRAPGAEPTNDPTEPNFPFLDFVSFPFRFCFRRQGAQLIINAR